MHESWFLCFAISFGMIVLLGAHVEHSRLRWVVVRLGFGIGRAVCAETQHKILDLFHNTNNNAMHLRRLGVSYLSPITIWSFKVI